MRIYISGPMSGLPDFNYPAFHDASAQWRAAGYEVLSPAELDLAETTDLTWEDYLRRDLRMLLDCDAIALLDGWENSRGAALEYHVATALGLRCFPAWPVVDPDTALVPNVL